MHLNIFSVLFNKWDIIEDILKLIRSKYELEFN